MQGQVKSEAHSYRLLQVTSLSHILKTKTFYEFHQIGTHMRSLSSRPALNNARASSASAGQQRVEDNRAKINQSTVRFKCRNTEHIHSATHSNNHWTAAPIMVVCFQGDKSHRPRPVPRSKLTGRSREFMYFSKTFFL